MRTLHARSLAAALAGLLCTGCPSTSGEAPYRVLLAAFDPATDRLVPREVTVETATDLAALQGPVARRISANARMVLDDRILIEETTTVEELRQAAIKDQGTDVRVEVFHDGEAWVPADFDAFVLLSVYYNLERSRAWFQGAAGDAFATYPAPDVLYAASLKFPSSLFSASDNAFFMPFVWSIAIAPPSVLQTAPLAVNGGVIAHEYSHSVFGWRVYDAAPVPRTYFRWSPYSAPGLNLLDALDEGLADLFATAILCSDDLLDCTPDFFTASLPPEHGVARRIDGLHCDEGQVALLRLSSGAWSYFAYELGSIFASAVWRAGSDEALVRRFGATEARRQVLQATFDALRGDGTRLGWYELIDLAGYDQSRFALWTGANPGVLDAVVNAAPEAETRLALCRAFLDRFRFASELIASCPPDVTPYGECP